MRITPLDIAGAAILETDRRGDERGSFARWFCTNELATLLGDSQVCQVNHSFTQEQGSIRGLHFQHPPAAEKKIIRCLVGAVFDVVADLRAGSPTFLQWRSVELSAKNDRALLLPEGCAHGFQTLASDTQLLYLHTAFYTPALEAGLRYNDPRLNIAWPLPPAQLSARDQQHPLLTEDFRGIEP
ncbi:dTDP-4-dehydrorhamnose 3,5-epimerase [Silvimonas terrae]|uniref:dTDP-4-dehydrorhamnose 3,5-epimerase n=1 Tax=Silvimonas terrae TaxID=300266 RepID=A0A840RBY0_9NEIS|nr:dTDP-4-dehydrorhamnose 3,5-epimerase family protein [Silvimonas terrae]MBB5189936.1 dTDP-4-dehydrorhamnose 3,5-epimerase [Silvimonas terrae]